MMSTLMLFSLLVSLLVSLFIVVWFLMVNYKVKFEKKTSFVKMGAIIGALWGNISMLYTLPTLSTVYPILSAIEKIVFFPGYASSMIFAHSFWFTALYFPFAVVLGILIGTFLGFVIPKLFNN